MPWSHRSGHQRSGDSHGGGPAITAVRTTRAASRRARPRCSTRSWRASVDAAHHGRRHAASGYRFEAIPDGISVRTRGQGRVDLYVNHETSKVPFPYVTGDADRGQRRERLRQRAGEPADPQPALGRRPQRLVRDPEQRGLPALLLELPGDGKEGFDRDILFTNEESLDWVLRQEDSWPPAIGDPDEQRDRRSSSRSTSRPASTTRSRAWAGTTTRTASPIPGYEQPSSSRATTRSRAVR